MWCGIYLFIPTRRLPIRLRLRRFLIRLSPTRYKWGGLNKRTAALRLPWSRRRLSLMARISQTELERLRSSVWPALERDNALPAGILNAVATWETRNTFENDAVSGAGAQGIFQLTAIALRQIKKDTGMTINPRNIYEASKGAAFLLKRLGRLFAGHLALVLAAYNAGEGTIRRYMVSVRNTGSGFLPRETTDYIVNVSRLVRA